MTPPSPLLTNAEAAEYLRLDTDYPELGNAVDAMLRLARKHKLRPIEGIGKTYKWRRSELDRFIKERVRASVIEAEGKPPSGDQKGRLLEDGHLHGHSDATFGGP